MRASRQPRRGRSAASTSPIAGQQRDRRQLEIVAPPSQGRPPSRRASASRRAAPPRRRKPRAARGTPTAVASATPGIDQHHAARGQGGRRRQDLAHAAHPRRPAGQTDRHVGAQPRREPSQQPGRRRSAPSRGRAAATPPPRPPSRRRCRTQPGVVCPASSARRRNAGRVRQRPGRTQHQIVRLRRQRRRERAGHRRATDPRPAPPQSGRRHRRTPPGCPADDSRRRAGRCTCRNRLTLAGAGSHQLDGAKPLLHH